MGQEVELRWDVVRCVGLKNQGKHGWSPLGLLLAIGLVLGCRTNPAPRTGAIPEAPRDATQLEREPGSRGTDPQLSSSRPGQGADLSLPAGESTPVAFQSSAPLPTSDDVRALVWQAGRLLLAGLPAVRSSERSLRSERSREELRENLAGGGPLRAFWLRELELLLQQPYTGQDEIWSAAARALGRLGIYEHSQLIAHGLDASAFPGRVEAAREALHQLFGVWFQGEHDFEPYLESGQLGQHRGLLLERALENERIARERLIELFSLRPELATEYVAALDPAIRIAAAQALGTALKRAPLAEGESEPLLPLLFARLKKERDPRVFHALLTSLGQLTESQAFDAPDVVRLRKVLVAERVVGNTLARAQAMALLPWRLEGELGEDHIYTAVQHLGSLIHALAESDRRRGSPDPDPMIEALVALQIVCDRAAAAGLGDGLRDLDVRLELLALVRGRYYPDVVRVAASDAFGAFVRPDDWSVLVAVMNEDHGLPALRYGVLGLLHSLLLKFEVRDPGAQALIELVVEESGGTTDPDLRRRALAILGDPALKPLIETLDASFLVQRLVEEEVSDLALSVIRLLETFGKPEMLAPCLSSARFELLAADPNSLPALARMCTKLAAGDPQSSLAAAQRLAGTRTDDVSLGRLQQALEVIAALEEGEAMLLSPAGQRQICTWAWELQVLGVSLESAYKLAFIQRLARVHWPRCGPEVDASSAAYLFDEPARKHLLAVLLGIEAKQLQARGDAGFAAAKDAANKAYVLAAKSAAEHEGKAFRSDLLLEVSRDRARYYHATNQWPEALEQFSFLVAQEALALPDLRTAVEIMTAIGDGTNRSGISEALFNLQRTAIEHPTWPAEPLALRMNDLRELSTSAMQDPGGANSEHFVELLADLPSLPVEGEPATAPSESGEADGEPPSGAAPVWTGLSLDPGRLEELHELRQRHLAAIDRARAKAIESGAALEATKALPGLEKKPQ